MPFLGGLAIEPDGLGLVLVDAAAVAIAIAEIRGRKEIALLRSELEQAEGFGLVLGDAAAFIVKTAQIVLPRALPCAMARR